VEHVRAFSQQSSLVFPDVQPDQAAPIAAPAVWRVLVVEDIPSLQRLLVMMLRKAGHEVAAAANGQEAVDFVEREPFDIILMDIQMPGMNGLDATRLIRAREESSGEHVPIIAVTAHALNGDSQTCLAAGADAYMRKPVNLLELIALMQRLMAST
jgi:two-component system sensor histidine kinase/response regulator